MNEKRATRSYAVNVVPFVDISSKLLPFFTKFDRAWKTVKQCCRFQGINEIAVDRHLGFDTENVAVKSEVIGYPLGNFNVRYGSLLNLYY